MTSLLWAAFCIAATALLLVVVIRLALRAEPPDDPDYSGGL